MKIGYTYVVGDIIHRGHLSYLQSAKSLCDRLIVGVLTDEAVMEKKPKPTMLFDERIQLIAALACVDAAVAQETYSPYDNVRHLKPDIVFESTSHEEDYVGELGIRVVTLPYYPMRSSTAIKKEIRDA